MTMFDEYGPEDLDKKFINDMYEDCLTDENHFHAPVEVLGPDLVENRSGIVLISPIALEEYSEYIDYMFGQIRAFHNISTPYMAFKEGFITYQNDYWTEDTETILKLYALGIANGTIYPFVKAKNGVLATMKDPLVIPTLDTGDPRFSEWFENVYKKEYKPRFKK